MQPYKQPSATPVPKVAAVGISGIIVTLITLGAALFRINLPQGWSDNVPAVVAGVTAAISLLHFLVGYFKHDTVKLEEPPIVTTPVAATPIITSGGKV